MWEPTVQPAPAGQRAPWGGALGRQAGAVQLHRQEGGAVGGATRTRVWAGPHGAGPCVRPAHGFLPSLLFTR